MTLLRERVQQHRMELRRRGLRPVQIWIPDTRAPGFAEEAHRQSQAVAAADAKDGIREWLEAVSIFPADDAAG
jgi:Antitoxin MazE-like